MELHLDGKVAIVTGASRGIGRAIASELAGQKMRVAIAARDEAKLTELAEEIASAGGEALPLARDLGEASAPADLAAATLERFGRIDAIVNNAGATRRGDFLTLSEQDWADGFALKFFGAVRLTRAAWPHLVAARGAVVNIAGVGGRTGSAEFTIGGSVNAAMLNLTKSLSDRGVADGVRVNAINPGSIRTDRLTARIEQLARGENLSFEQAQRLLASRQGIARFGQPQEVAHLVAFLLSERSAYVQGAILDLDGGMTRTM